MACPTSDNLLDHLRCRECQECECPCHVGRRLFQGKIKFRKERTRIFLSSPREPYTTVYRVEDDEGQGPFRRLPDNTGGSPFRRGAWGEVSKRKGRACILTLGPDDVFDDETLVRFGFFKEWFYYKDGETLYHGYRNKFLYACEDARQLKLWFSRRDMKVMHKFGFHVRPRKASIVLYSPVQCAFIPYEEDEQPALTIREAS